MIQRNITRSPMRDRILDAADGLLGRFGFQKTTAEDLAREAGIGRRTIYVHFTSKEEIFLASIDRVVERLIGELKRVLYSGGPADERLRKMMVARILFRFDQVHAYHQNLDDMFRVLRPAYLERREDYFKHEADVFARVIEEAQRAALVVAGNSYELAATVLTATNGLLPYSLSERELADRPGVEKRIESLSHLVLKGLRPAG